MQNIEVCEMKPGHYIADTEIYWPTRSRTTAPVNGEMKFSRYTVKKKERKKTCL